MIVYICAFTDAGREKADQLNILLDEYVVRIKDREDTVSFVKEAFELRAALIFIGATGIAVRMIAPFIKDKLTDSPVLVMDEKGKYIIPILSGHVGGANKLAEKIAESIDVTPVITTATDINDVFAIDVFAKDNFYRIINREGISVVSSKLLRGEKATVSVRSGCAALASRLPDNLMLLPYSADCKADIVLESKSIAIGIGCKKNTDFEKLNAFVNKYVEDWSDVIGLASIDLKSREYAIAALASKNGVPFTTFSAEELAEVKGDFDESDFVKEVTGVGNVSERSAMALAEGVVCSAFSDSEAGKEVMAELVLKKTAHEGMTIAIARINW